MSLVKEHVQVERTREQIELLLLDKRLLDKEELETVSHGTSIFGI